MSLVVIKVVSEHSRFFGNYGPFESEEKAAEYLRGKGWWENINGTRGLWYIQSGRYEGINARIELLETHDNLPESIAFRDSRFMQI